MSIFGKKGGKKAAAAGSEMLSTTSTAVMSHDAPKPLPVIGKFTAATQNKVAGYLLVTSLAVAGALGYLGTSSLSGDTKNTEIATTVQMLTQRLAKAAQLATTGDETGIKQVRETRVNFETQMKALTSGSSGSSEEAKQALMELTGSVDKLMVDVDAIIKLEGDLRQIKKHAATSKRAGGDIYLLSEQLAAIFYQRGAPGIYLSLSNHLFNVSQRLSRNADALLLDETVDVAVLGEFTVDYNDFGSFLALLTVGDRKLGISPVNDADSRLIVAEMTDSFKRFSEAADYINKNAANIVKVKRNVANIYKLSDTSLASAERLTGLYGSAQGQSQLLLAGSGLALIVAVFSLLLFSLINGRLARINAYTSGVTTKDTEDAIIRLMGEMQPIGDGDLTATATVTEAMTGGIASMLNETVASVRSAMQRVLDTVGSVTQSVENSKQTSRRLIESSVSQDKEIGSAVEAVGALTRSIEQVSNNANSTAEVARNAKVVADGGKSIVDDVNEAMGQIRDNMQNVLKGVKRLGETSQEIGGIVETIEDIVDKTQVLAVNASLQAAAAGEAGHGFRVVASEVKRLAERSAEALKTITVLVQRNQGETQASISEVETATTYVVRGAELSERAGDALNKVSEVVDQVHGLLESINKATNEQTGGAAKVSEIMTRLRTISEGAMQSVKSSVQSVQEITNQMKKLQDDIAQFKTGNNK